MDDETPGNSGAGAKMGKNLKDLWRRAKKYWVNHGYPSLVARQSYSQSGEDLIIEFACRAMGIQKISYLDIGAYDPVELSNTYRFYRQGSRGTCIEPNPLLFERYRRKRSRDRCYNYGIGSSGTTQTDFYILTNPTLSTFSQAEAERYSTYPGEKIERVVKVPIVGINELLGSLDQVPHLISLDTEGFDLPIIQALDFACYRPHVFCIETLTYTTDRREEKINAISEHMIENGYFIYGDTYINTIFVEQKAWRIR